MQAVGIALTHRDGDGEMDVCQRAGPERRAGAVGVIGLVEIDHDRMVGIDLVIGVVESQIDVTASGISTLARQLIGEEALRAFDRGRIVATGIDRKQE